MTPETVEGLVNVVKMQVNLACIALDKMGLLEDYLNEIPVETTNRRGMKAGFFHGLGDGDVGRVVINVGVCYDEQRFVDTLIHELAHAVCHWVHGKDKDSHGPKWKAIMVQLGQKPGRCHNYMDRK